MWIPVKYLPYIILISQLSRIHEIHCPVFNLGKKSTFLELRSKLCFKFVFDHHRITLQIRIWNRFWQQKVVFMFAIEFFQNFILHKLF